MFTTANLAIILMCRTQNAFYLYIFLLKIIKTEMKRPPDRINNFALVS